MALDSDTPRQKGCEREILPKNSRWDGPERGWEWWERVISPLLLSQLTQAKWFLTKNSPSGRNSHSHFPPREMGNGKWEFHDRPGGGNGEKRSPWEAWETGNVGACRWALGWACGISFRVGSNQRVMHGCIREARPAAATTTTTSVCPPSKPSPSLPSSPSLPPSSGISPRASLSPA